jgi:hypothetical protein
MAHVRALAHTGMDKTILRNPPPESRFPVRQAQESYATIILPTERMFHWMNEEAPKVDRCAAQSSVEADDQWQ